jgi:hypothetical protein
MRPSLRLTLLLAASICGSAHAAASGTVDGTCEEAREPALSELSSLVAGIAPAPPPLPAPGPMPSAQLAAMDARTEELWPQSDFEKRIIRENQSLAVPGSYQGGGTCMFRSLRMVSMYWRSIGHDVQAIPVDDWSGLPAQGDAVAYARDVLGVDGAQQLGIGTNGAMAVAQHYGFDASVKQGANLRDLKDALRAGTPPIVTFYCCEEGKPSATILRDDKGNVVPMFHAGVIEGIDENRGVVLLKHPWRRSTPFVVPIRDFEASWKLAGKELLVVKPKNYRGPK